LKTEVHKNNILITGYDMYIVNTEL